MASEFEYYLTLDDSQLKAALDGVDKKFQETAVKGDTAAKQVGNSWNREVRSLIPLLNQFGLTGVSNLASIATQFGVATAGGVGLALGVKALIDLFISLGKQAIETLEQIIDKSVDVASGFEIAGAQFKGIFEGSEAAATAAIDRLKRLSVELGTDAVAIGRAFLPEVSSLDQLEEVVRLAVALQRAQPEQGLLGARIALIEGAAGDLISLRRRFEIPQAAIERIRQLQEELGPVEGLIQGLGDELQRTGRDVETLGDTFQTAADQTQQRWEMFLGTLGTPLVKELKEQFQGLNEELDKSEPDLQVVATAVGNVAAAFASLTGEGLRDLIADIDPDKVLTLLNALYSLVDVGGILIRMLTGGAEALDALDFSLMVATGLIRDFEKDVEGVIRTIALLSAGFAALEAAARNALLFEQFRRGLITPQEFQEGLIDPIDAFNDILKDSEKMLAEHQQRVEDNQEALEEYRDSLDDTNEAGASLADTILGLRQAEEDLVTTQQQVADTQAQIAEQMAKVQKEIEKRRMEIEANYLRRQIELEIDAAEQREKIARDHLREIEKIERQHNQRRADAGVDLARDTEDAERDAARDLIDFEKETAAKRVQAEIDFQRELQRINRDGRRELRKAIRDNDAIAFIEAKERMQEQLEEARISHQEEGEDAARAAEERREELRVALEREIEDANIANRRKLEDLATALQRELEEARIKNKQELQEQEISEQSKREALGRSYKNQLEDFEAFKTDKLNNLRLALVDELRIVAEGQQLIAELEQEMYDLRLQQQEQFRDTWLGNLMDSFNNLTNLGGANPTGVGGLGGGIGNRAVPGQQPLPRATGGEVWPDQDFLIGEGGIPEMLRISRSGYGYVRPLTSALAGRPAPMQVTNNNQRSGQVSISLLDYTQMTAAQRAMARAEATAVLNEYLKT